MRNDASTSLAGLGKGRTGSVSESLESKLVAVRSEIVDLETKGREAEKRLEQLGLAQFSISSDAREAYKAKFLELEDIEKKLNDARARQLSYLLTSINESSNRLETATKSLQQSAESQVQVTTRLLNSSKHLERFTVWLIVIAATSMYLIVYTQVPFPFGIGAIVALFALLILALRYPWARKQRHEIACN